MSEIQGIISDKPLAETDERARIYRKVMFRIVPFLFLCYILAYLDRVNVGFAKLQMLTDLHMSEVAYGTGAGIFFLAYFLFEVPSNLLMHKVGARIWIARIMFTWGIISICMMFVRSEMWFYILRFLLGAAEAGFYPGVIYYLSNWFPSSRRARVMGGFYLALPVAGMIGNPISGAIMEYFHGMNGMRNWEWLFLIEGIPSVIVGIWTWFFLDDSVEKAKWLTNHEKEIIISDLKKETGNIASHSVRSGFSNPFVWYLSLIYLLMVMGTSAFDYWLPSLIKDIGFASSGKIGLIAALPNILAIVAMLVVTASSDAFQERRWHVALCCVAGAIGLTGSALMGHNAVFSIGFLCLSLMGLRAAAPVFWTLPSVFLTGIASAAGIAVINSVGNLAGYLSPTLIGFIKDQTGSTSAALYIISGCQILAAILILNAGRMIAAAERKNR